MDGFQMTQYQLEHAQQDVKIHDFIPFPKAQAYMIEVVWHGKPHGLSSTFFGYFPENREGLPGFTVWLGSATQPLGGASQPATLLVPATPQWATAPSSTSSGKDSAAAIETTAQRNPPSVATVEAAAAQPSRPCSRK